MELKEFVDILLKASYIDGDRAKGINVETPLTDDFDKGPYGQNGDRWWGCKKAAADCPNYVGQRAHVINYFTCWSERGISPYKCEKVSADCRNCFENYDENSYTPKEDNNIPAQKIYGKMSRPEMYFFIAEVLGFDKEELEKCIAEVKKANDDAGGNWTKTKWKDIIKVHYKWEKIEEAANKYREENK